MVIIPPLLLCDDDDDDDLLLESPVGIMPNPPEMGGAVISLAGGPMAMAFGSSRVMVMVIIIVRCREYILQCNE